MDKAGEAFMKKWEQASEEEREAFTQSVDLEKQAERIVQIRNVVQDIKRGTHMNLPTIPVPVFEGEHPAEVLKKLPELIKAQTSAIRESSEQAGNDAREANKIARAAKAWAVVAVLAAVGCAVLSSLDRIVAFWSSFCR